MYAQEQAVEANLSPNKVVQVIGCETAGTWDPKKQSGHPRRHKIPSGYTPNGDPNLEQSFGLAQIHLIAHYKTVSYEQATDPYFAIDFLIRHWKAGDQEMWTCY